MMFLADRGYPCIAHDRGGHGRSSQTYPGLPHGLCSTHKDVVNADVLAFIKS
jgi:pimeloyl-ACP methyl ester carboxylesterase